MDSIAHNTEGFISLWFRRACMGEEDSSRATFLSHKDTSYNSQEIVYLR